MRKTELIDLLANQPIVKSEPDIKTGKLEDLTFVPMDHAVGKYLRGWKIDLDVDAKDLSAFLDNVKSINNE